MPSFVLPSDQHHIVLSWKMTLTLRCRRPQGWRVHSSVTIPRVSVAESWGKEVYLSRSACSCCHECQGFGQVASRLAHGGSMCEGLGFTVQESSLKRSTIAEKSCMTRRGFDESPRVSETRKSRNSAVDQQRVVEFSEVQCCSRWASQDLFLSRSSNYEQLIFRR